MHKQSIISCLFAVPLLLAGNAAFAGSYSPGIDARQANQSARIAQGVRSGELTRPETVRLVGQQAGLRAMERRFEADGRLGPVERVRLHNRLDRTSGTIFTQKHDHGRR